MIRIPRTIQTIADGYFAPVGCIGVWGEDRRPDVDAVDIGDAGANVIGGVYMRQAT